MKKLVLIIAGAFISVIALAQAPTNTTPYNSNTQPNSQPNTIPNMQNPSNPTMRQTDPTILNPSMSYPNQRLDTPAYKQRSDTTRMRRDSTNSNYRRSRIDSMPRDDRDPNRIPK